MTPLTYHKLTRLIFQATAFFVCLVAGASYLHAAGTPAGVETSAFLIDAAVPSLNFQATIRLLESFGDVRVLSSPKLSVLNNQTALLRVTRDIVYFTITPSSTPITVAGGSGNGAAFVQAAGGTAHGHSDGPTLALRVNG